MEKIKKLIPDKISLVGQQVVISEKQFNQMVKTINLQTDTINCLIDALLETDKHIDSVDNTNTVLKESIKKLANAIQIYLEV